jgi:hypothetical protein
MAMVPPGEADTLACDATNSRRDSSTEAHRNDLPFRRTVSASRMRSMTAVLFPVERCWLLPYSRDRK